MLVEMIEVVKARVAGAILMNQKKKKNQFRLHAHRFYWPLWRIRAKKTTRERVFVSPVEDPATWATPRASPSAMPWITKPRRRTKARPLSALASRVLGIIGGSWRRSAEFPRPISPSSASNSTSEVELGMEENGSIGGYEWEWGEISCSMINMRVNPTTRHKAMRPVGGSSVWAASIASIPLIPSTLREQLPKGWRHEVGRTPELLRPVQLRAEDQFLGLKDVPSDFLFQ